MNEFVEQPLKKRMNRRNIYTRLDALETAMGPRPSARVNTLDETTGNTGTLVVDNLIVPAPGVLVTDPTNVGYTGSAITGGGTTFGSNIMHIFSVAAGVLQAGWNTAGKFLAGAGSVILDEDGITITEGLLDQNSIKWKTAAGETIFNITALGPGIAVAVLSVTAPTGGSDGKLGFSAYDEGSDFGATIELLADETPGLGIITSEADKFIFQHSDLQGTSANIGVIINEKGSANFDTRIEGDADANLVFVDASADRVGIGTATPAVKLDVVGGINASGDIRTTGLLNIGAPGSLTIASGAITVTKSHHSVDTESAAATDDLDTINGGTIGDVVVIRAANNARDVVVKNGTGNIFCGSDFTLNNINDTITLMLRTTNVWVQLSRSDNSA